MFNWKYLRYVRLLPDYTGIGQLWQPPSFLTLCSLCHAGLEERHPQRRTALPLVHHCGYEARGCAVVGEGIVSLTAT
jgi:hypothetical protein